MKNGHDVLHNDIEITDADCPIPYKITTLGHQYLDGLLCICGHLPDKHSEFLDKHPNSKLAEAPILKHCTAGWSTNQGFQCHCPVYHPRQVK